MSQEHDAENPQLTLDDVLHDTAVDVVAPSPVADMGVTPFSGRAGEGVTPPPLSEPEKKKRGRPRKNPDDMKIDAKPQPRPALAGIGQTVSHETAAINPAAEVAVMMVNTSGMMIGGADAAMKTEEALLAKEGFVAYFRAKGVNNVPPWVILAGALSPYYLRVITTTPAKSKISTFFSNAFAYVKGFFKGSKNARSYRGDDVKRENNAGEKTS